MAAFLFGRFGRDRSDERNRTNGYDRLGGRLGPIEANYPRRRFECVSRDGGHRGDVHCDPIEANYQGGSDRLDGREHWNRSKRDDDRLRSNGMNDPA